MRYRPTPYKPHPPPHSHFRAFRCDHCLHNKPDCPMLKNEVWFTIAPNPRNPKRGLLCIPCTEVRLGRQLTVDDLLECPGNAFTFLLVDRHEANKL